MLEATPVLVLTPLTNLACQLLLAGWLALAMLDRADRVCLACNSGVTGDASSPASEKPTSPVSGATALEYLCCCVMQSCHWFHTQAVQEKEPKCIWVLSVRPWLL